MKAPCHIFVTFGNAGEFSLICVKLICLKITCSFVQFRSVLLFVFVYICFL